MKNVDKIKSLTSKTSNFQQLKNEKMLSICVDDQAQRCMPLKQMLIREKAKSIFSYMQNETGDASENFIASRSRSDRFRNNCSNVKATQEFSEQDVQQLLEPHSKSPSNDDFMELSELRTYNSDSDDFRL
ncbi:Tigger transposable element-derived protein 1 [Trichinella patagoniensis]|uniref:Tigger transposable element-derived protein 1 n=1 Tax=Trichinella patagoniensis TaxID=990121 RepID=A0A0V0ZWM9_9BILA|nr:Tigger transposable element-derived protein 1 [Trichinella patagoniensis]